MKLTMDSQALKVTAGLAFAGLVLFGASLNDPFHFDDTLIFNDSNVTNSARWFHFLNPLHLRQVTFFSFYLNHLVGGASPDGYHAVNVALHIANSVLIFLLVRKFVEGWIATAAAAVFLAHPIQTESVLYVYQRSILLACFFSLSGLLALEARKHGMAALLFFLAFESKESALAVPLAVTLLYGFQADKIGSGNRRLRISLFAGVLVLAALALGLLVYWEETTVGFGASKEISVWEYFWTETRVVYTYLRLMFFPYPQSLEYESPSPPGVLPLFGIAAIVVAGWQLAKRPRWRIAGICILAFFILLAPTSSVIPSQDAAFEHRLYLPALAFSLLTAWLLSRLPRRTWLAASIVLLLGLLTIRRGTIWSSEIALWEDTVRKAPGKARAWFNLGGAYLNAQPEKARTALNRALELEPNLVEALYDLGVIEQRLGNWTKALTYYEKATDKDPEYWPAWNNMGNTLFSMGHRERAIQYFERTLNLNPDYWPAQYNVAIVHFMSGRYTEAVPKLRIVLDWQPDFREARYLLAQSISRTGNKRAADEEMKKLGEITATELRNTPPMILAPNRP